MNPFRFHFPADFVAGRESVAYAASFQYCASETRTTFQTTPSAGVAMMGGRSDIDEGFAGSARRLTAATS